MAWLFGLIALAMVGIILGGLTRVWLERPKVPSRRQVERLAREAKKGKQS